MTLEQIRQKTMEKGAEKLVTGGQMCEIMHLMLSVLAEVDLYDVVKLLKDYRPKKRGEICTVRFCGLRKPRRGQ